jgi:hypothetical protein
MSSIDHHETAGDERCEVCGATILGHELHCVLEPREGEPREICAVLVGHLECLPGTALSVPEALAYMESVEARAAGHALLTL